jgi:hypothetical protein
MQGQNTSINTNTNTQTQTPSDMLKAASLLESLSEQAHKLGPIDGNQEEKT